MNSSTRICPTCAATLSATDSACPACGQPAAAIAGAPTSSPKQRRGWIVFFVVLLLPAILTLLTAKSEEVWPIFTFGLGMLAAIYCGAWLARRICQAFWARVLVGLALSAVFFVLSFFLCCAGCAIGGAELNIH